MPVNYIERFKIWRLFFADKVEPEPIFDERKKIYTYKKIYSFIGWDGKREYKELFRFKLLK